MREWEKMLQSVQRNIQRPDKYLSPWEMLKPIFLIDAKLAYWRVSGAGTSIEASPNRIYLQI